MQVWQLDLVTTSMITVMLVMLGYRLKHRIKVLERFCIPVAVIGGFIAALFILFLKETGAGIVNFDTTLQMPAMVAFFTTIGLGGSLKSISQGGRILLVYALICWVLVIFQDIMGATLAHFLGLDPVFGIMAGGVSLQGGHGTAAAFGYMAEEMGVPDATTIALACATFGLIAGGVLGGPVASFLIKRHKLLLPAQLPDNDPPPLHDREENLQLTSYQLISSGGLILVLMSIGFWASGLFT
ncbi:MAG TPA: sodium/glutamate symporter, partial [Gammaproteobacteria bacterium]|nr:sodium/glutamate symporter [Gammaproteobacteria bacterium]